MAKPTAFNCKPNGFAATVAFMLVVSPELGIIPPYSVEK
jgi:hypothetical protein